jgi:hypothetical protein
VLTVRFSEIESYDINQDADVILYMATTSNGSFFAYGPSDREQVKRRKQFKEKVIELMQEGLNPGEIEFDACTD